jgi:hypothetical protein
VFENRVLRRIFGPKYEVTGEWRKLHNEKLHILYSSPNIIRQIKSRRMRWTGHVARMEEESVKGLGESLKERDRSEDYGRMGSEWILGRLGGVYGVDSVGSGYWPVAGCCECVDERSGSGATEFRKRHSVRDVSLP